MIRWVLTVSLIFPLLALMMVQPLPCAAALSVTVYNDAACSPSQVNSSLSYTLPSLGYYGSPTNWSCSINVTAAPPPPPSVSSTVNLVYWCRTSASLNSTAFQAYLLSPAAMDCNNASNNYINYQANSFTPNTCTSLQLLNVQPSVRYQAWALIDCSATSTPIPSNNEAAPVAYASVSNLLSSIFVVAAIWRGMNQW